MANKWMMMMLLLLVVINALIMWSARRGGASTPRRQGLTNGHVNGASSPAAEPASQAESSLFSSPTPRRGLLHRSLYQCCYLFNPFMQMLFWPHIQNCRLAGS